MNRMSFLKTCMTGLAGAIAGLFSFLRPSRADVHGEKVDDCVRRLTAHLEAGQFPSMDQIEQLLKLLAPVSIKDPRRRLASELVEGLDCLDLSTFRFPIVMGASSPGVFFADVEDQLEVFEVDKPIHFTDMAEEEGAWFQRWSKKQLDLGYYPRPQEFRVQHQLVLGTIDEIVEDFKHSLVACFRRQYDDLANSISGCRDDALKFQDHYAKLRDDRVGMAPANTAVHISVYPSKKTDHPMLRRVRKEQLKFKEPQ